MAPNSRAQSSLALSVSSRSTAPVPGSGFRDDDVHQLDRLTLLSSNHAAHCVIHQFATTALRIKPIPSMDTSITSPCCR